MTRVKGGARAHQRHKKIIKLAKGYRGSRHSLFKRANEAVIRAREHSFAGRKQKKRDFRRLWIARISGALTDKGINYSRFINGLGKANVELDRKILSELAISDPKAFDEVVKLAKGK